MRKGGSINNVRYAKRGRAAMEKKVRGTCSKVYPRHNRRPTTTSTATMQEKKETAERAREEKKQNIMESMKNIISW